jgi:hypothetical protein
MARYTQLGIRYFNPQVENWNPEFAAVEARHLVEDELILFPVTNETLGAGSLAETAFSILETLRSDANRFLVFYIAPDLSPELTAQDAQGAAASVRVRALVRAHLLAKRHPTVLVVQSLEQMLEVSLLLHHALHLIGCARSAASSTQPVLVPPNP